MRLPLSRFAHQPRLGVGSRCRAVRLASIVRHGHDCTSDRIMPPTSRRAPSGLRPRCVRGVLETRDEPGWITDLRRKAFDVYSQKARSRRSIRKNSSGSTCGPFGPTIIGILPDGGLRHGRVRHAARRPGELRRQRGPRERPSDASRARREARAARRALRRSGDARPRSSRASSSRT